MATDDAPHDDFGHNTVCACADAEGVIGALATVRSARTGQHTVVLYGGSNGNPHRIRALISSTILECR
jgi:hypothetical protein